MDYETIFGKMIDKLEGRSMNTEEANKIIAEFMGREIVKKGYYYFLINQVDSTDLDSIYAESLDALVPVWEKAGICPSPRLFKTHWECGFENTMTGTKEYMWDSKFETIQEAAAIATAKAILELKGESK